MFGKPDMSFTINVLTKNTASLDHLLNEAKGVFRKVRKIPATASDDFDIVKSDNLANMLIGNLSKVTMGATIIGLITLLGCSWLPISLIDCYLEQRQRVTLETCAAQPSVVCSST